MIASATDYRFVDFANGDMPTGNFDGSIMPLRQGNMKNPLKAEDIAFLHECVQDKMGAFSGVSFEWPVPSLYTEGIVMTPTKNISANQMTGIRNRLSTALSRGISNYGVGFLATPFTEYSNMFAQEFGSSPHSQFLSFLNTDHGLSMAPSSAQGDFAVGARVMRAPVASLFADAQNLTMPVFRWSTGFIDENLESVLVEGGTTPWANTGLGWILTNANPDQPNSNGAAWRYVKSSLDPLELASVPNDFLESADLYMAYTAYNSVWYTEDYVEDHDLDYRNIWYYACGLIKLNPSYATRTTSNNRIRFLTTSLQSKLLIDRIVSDCQWELYHVGNSDVSRQNVSVNTNSDLFLVGTPNGRTKWW
jgi:hypothetical protein